MISDLNKSDEGDGVDVDCKLCNWLMLAIGLENDLNIAIEPDLEVPVIISENLSGAFGGVLSMSCKGLCLSTSDVNANVPLPPLLPRDAIELYRFGRFPA